MCILSSKIITWNILIKAMKTIFVKAYFLIQFLNLNKKKENKIRKHFPKLSL